MESINNKIILVCINGTLMRFNCLEYQTSKTPDGAEIQSFNFKNVVEPVSKTFKKPNNAGSYHKRPMNDLSDDQIQSEPTVKVFHASKR